MITPEGMASIDMDVHVHWQVVWNLVHDPRIRHWHIHGIRSGSARQLPCSLVGYVVRFPLGSLLDAARGVARMCLEHHLQGFQAVLRQRDVGLFTWRHL